MLYPVVSVMSKSLSLALICLNGKTLCNTLLPFHHKLMKESMPINYQPEKKHPQRELTF